MTGLLIKGTTQYDIIRFSKILDADRLLINMDIYFFSMQSNVRYLTSVLFPHSVCQIGYFYMLFLQDDFKSNFI